MFTGELTEAQLQPANKLCARKRLLLAWCQGSGKTVIALAAAEKLLELGYISTVLILARTDTEAWQWQEKIKEFTDHDGRLVEAKNKPSREYHSYEALYTIMPYSVFRRDYKKLLSRHYDLVIADEAQEFSSFRSKTFKCIKKFRSPYRWALTGTAISTKLEELYAILQWIDPYLLPRWPEFEKRHLVRNRNTNAIIKYKNLRELHQYLSKTRVDRKSYEELKDQLPELVPYKIYIEKDKEVRDSENELYAAIDNASSDGTTVWTSIDPYVSRALHRARKATTNTKLERAEELIRSILSEDDNNRIVVYSYYKEPLYLLQGLLGQSRAGLFTGDQKSAEKRTNLALFKHKDVRVLLCSDAGKAGLDLPFANYTIFLDVPFGWSTFDQRARRTQRTSSKFESVIVIYLIVRNSIEEYYFQTTGNKGQLQEAALEGGKDSIVMKPSSLKAYLDEVRSKS